MTATPASSVPRLRNGMAFETTSRRLHYFQAYQTIIIVAGLILSLLSPAAAGEKKREVSLKQLHRHWEQIAGDTAGIDSAARSPAPVESANDTGAKVVLLTGDSMIDCLAWTIEPWCQRHGYTVARASFIASTTENWAKNRYLARLLKKHHPSFVMICLGSNEYYFAAGNIRNRSPFVKEIVDEAGALPLIWIGPPNLDSVKELNAVVASVIGADRYFSSSELVLDRQLDNRHPSIPAAAVWADTVCRWIQFTSRYQLPIMPRPTNEGSVYLRNNYPEIARARTAALHEALRRAKIDSLASAIEEDDRRFWEPADLIYPGPIPR
jgi:hypothetical protein